MNKTISAMTARRIERLTLVAIIGLLIFMYGQAGTDRFTGTEAKEAHDDRAAIKRLLCKNHPEDCAAEGLE